MFWSSANILRFYLVVNYLVSDVTYILYVFTVTKLNNFIYVPKKIVSQLVLLSSFFYFIILMEFYLSPSANSNALVDSIHKNKIWNMQTNFRIFHLFIQFVLQTKLIYNPFVMCHKIYLVTSISQVKTNLKVSRQFSHR